MAVVFFRPYEITFAVEPLDVGDEADLKSIVKFSFRDSAMANAICLTPDGTLDVTRERGENNRYRLRACVQRHESPDDVYSALMAEFRAAGWDDGTDRHRRWLKERGIDVSAEASA